MARKLSELNALLVEYSQLPEYLLFDKVTVDTRSSFGDFPINIAATRGSLYELEVLISFGADVNAKGEHGYTPLHNAVEQGNKSAVMHLLKCGADSFLKTNDGDTPRDLADVLGETQICSLFDEAG